MNDSKKVIELPEDIKTLTTDNLVFTDTIGNFKAPRSEFSAGASAFRSCFTPNGDSNFLNNFRTGFFLFPATFYRRRATFSFPAEAISLSEAALVMRLGNFGTVDVALLSEYGAPGESESNHSESNTLINEPFVLNELKFIDISSVFTNISAGDICGIQVDLLFNDAGASTNLSFGVFIKYGI
ncbi:hypothetical protein LCGC14_1783910 [marine sediment metagenome]|uniref:Uncharacterized protein n=1 Tax=marine sediment metagenome TaxID=412755 RepID=A0A0F9JU77_9ZZZZ